MRLILVILLFITLIFNVFSSANDSIPYVYVTIKLGRSGPEDPSIKITDSVYVDSIITAFENAKNRNTDITCTPESGVWGRDLELWITGLGGTTLNRGCTSSCGSDSGRIIEKLLYRSILAIDTLWAEYVCGPLEFAQKGCNNSSTVNQNSKKSSTFVTPNNQTNPGAYSLDGKLVPENVPISSPGVQKGKTPKVILPNSNTRDNK